MIKVLRHRERRHLLHARTLRNLGHLMSMAALRLFLPVYPN